MITLNDVDKIVISSFCKSSFPCQHFSTVTLKDGRSASGLSSIQIYSIVSNVAKERINPGEHEHWCADRVIQHFSDSVAPMLGVCMWFEVESSEDEFVEVKLGSESPETVLNKIFSNTINQSI